MALAFAVFGVLADRDEDGKPPSYYEISLIPIVDDDGKVTAVVFWAAWSPRSKPMLGDMDALYRADIIPMSITRAKIILSGAIDRAARATAMPRSVK